MVLNKEDARKVAADQLREVGLLDESKWIEHPTSVRKLLALESLNEDGLCSSCEMGSGYSPHLANCDVAAAWHEVGDVRAAEDVELAHERAIDDFRAESILAAQRLCTHPLIVPNRHFAPTRECTTCGKYFFQDQAAPLPKNHATLDLPRSLAERITMLGPMLKAMRITQEQYQQLLAIPE